MIKDEFCKTKRAIEIAELENEIKRLLGVLDSRNADISAYEHTLEESKYKNLEQVRLLEEYRK